MTRLGGIALGLSLLTTSPGAIQRVVSPVPSGADKPERVASCLDERFAEPVAPFNSVRFLPGKSPAFIAADDACLNLDADQCTKLTPMNPSHAWLAGARVGGYVCVTDGKQFGWTRKADLGLDPVPATPPREWIGSWRATYGEAQFDVTLKEDGKTPRVLGTAQWQAGPDATPHLGDLEGDGVLVANELRLGDVRCLDSEYQESHDACAQCVARLMFVSGRILVRDNHWCGGMNVNFDGVYDRKDKAPPGSLFR